MALLYYVRAVHNTFFGPLQKEPEKGEPLPVTLMLVLLVVLLVAAGIVPDIPASVFRGG